MNSVLKNLLFIVFTLGSYTLCLAQNEQTSFDLIYDAIAKKNFFKAREVYNDQKDYFSKEHQLFFEAIIDNAFNKLEDSNPKIETLLEGNSNLPDDLKAKLLLVYQGNAVKLFDYKKAKLATEKTLLTYANFLSEKETADQNNNLRIWSALAHVPKQTITKNSSLHLLMKKDKVGLDNLEISTPSSSENFIFDTGANISTITRSTALKLGIKLIPAEIEVGTITGTTVKSQLGVCDELNLGNIKIKNAVFLVFEDEDLYIQAIDYQIHGILGYPVLNALEEIQITQDGYFIVPDKSTPTNNEPNMALDGLTPLIAINGNHYAFDSGATNTMLYKPYYLSNKSDIEENFQPSKIAFGGAGGQAEFDGYTIDVTFDILDKKVHLKNIQLLTENIKEDNHLFGNIGQDVIRQFDKMTLNFKDMFIRFD